MISRIFSVKKVLTGILSDKDGADMIRFGCYYCGQKIETLDRFGGKKVKCPKCSHLIMAPKAEQITDEQFYRALLEKEIKQKHPDYSNLSDDQIARLLLKTKETASGTEDMKRERFRQQLRRFHLMPEYDEVILCVMSLMFIVMFLASPMQDVIISSLRSPESNAVIVFLSPFFFICAIFISIFNAFSTRKKSSIEKWVMLMFAICISAGTGILAGREIMKNTTNWLIIFPMWNIAYGFFLLTLLRLGLLDEDCIVDSNATRLQAEFGIFTALVIFAICHYGFGLHWAVTYSICIVYTTSIDRAARSVFGLN